MIICITEALTAEELTRLRTLLAEAEFADGKVTAGWHAKDVKNNLQLTLGMPGFEPAEQMVRAALARNAAFQMHVRPRIMRPLMFSRYETGMSYGLHVDDSIMSCPGVPAGQMRTDVSFTLFLADPASYQGGELAVDFGGGLEHLFKLPAGTLVAYPSNTLHRVVPVTSGARLAAIGWIQSEIRDHQQRSILSDLDMARRNLFAREGKSQTFDLLSKSHANLLRMWAES